MTRFLRKMLEEKGEEGNLPPYFQPGNSHLSFFSSRVLRARTAKRAARAAASRARAPPRVTGTGRTGPACSGVSAVCGSQKLGTLPDGTTPPSKNSRARNTQPNPREEAVLLRVGTRTTRAPRRKSRSSEVGLRSAVTSRTMMRLVLLLWHGAGSRLAGCTSLNSHHGLGRRQCYLRLSNEA